MESTFDTIRTALAEDTTPEQRAAGVAACHTLLGALDAQPTPSSSASSSPSPPAFAPSTHPLGSLPIDQVLDLVIVKLRSMLPPDQAATAPPGEPPLTIRMFRTGA
ncbi:MAG: hypothetical protein HS111_26315 [Kofleriaceae bacterium]|nr:hypothetical protein [Kofleriaceae bacterium]MCL4227295.1 hypothetical protein [Myxococcales bacterium]